MAPMWANGRLFLISRLPIGPWRWGRARPSPERPRVESQVCARHTLALAHGHAHTRKQKGERSLTFGCSVCSSQEARNLLSRQPHRRCRLWSVQGAGVCRGPRGAGTSRPPPSPGHGFFLGPTDTHCRLSPSVLPGSRLSCGSTTSPICGRERSRPFPPRAHGVARAAGEKQARRWPPAPGRSRDAPQPEAPASRPQARPLPGAEPP